MNKNKFDKILVATIIMIFIGGLFSCRPGANLQGHGDRKQGTEPLDPGSGLKPVPREQLLKGFINDVEWQFLQGKATVVSTRAGKFLRISLWNQVFTDPCLEFSGSHQRVVAKLPYKIGSYQAKQPDAFNPLSSSISFIDSDSVSSSKDGRFIKQGLIQLDTISNNQLNLMLIATTGQKSPAEPKSELAGWFSIYICD